MTLVAKEEPGRRTKINDKGEFEGTRKFIVQSATRLMGFEYVSGLPATGDPWPSVALPLYCVEKSAEEQEETTGGWVYYVTCNYEVRGINLNGDQGWSRNPLARPAIHSWPTDQQVQKMNLKDLDNKWFQNEADDWFDPPPPFMDILPTMQVRKNYPPTFWTAQKKLEVINHYNTDTFFKATAEQARIIQVAVGEPQLENDVLFAEASFLIEFRQESWQYEDVLNEGPRYYDAIFTKKWATDDDGIPSTRPTLLDAAGHKLPDGNDPTAVRFRVREGISFKSLGLC
jgi:hypothetical protein